MGKKYSRVIIGNLKKEKIKDIMGWYNYNRNQNKNANLCNDQEMYMYSYHKTKQHSEIFEKVIKQKRKQN